MTFLGEHVENLNSKQNYRRFKNGTHYKIHISYDMVLFTAAVRAILNGRDDLKFGRIRIRASAGSKRV